MEYRDSSLFIIELADKILHFLEILYNMIFIFKQYIPIFADVLFRILYSEDWMKRESGESPEQSRCCEFHIGCIITYATVS